MILSTLTRVKNPAIKGKITKIIEQRKANGDFKENENWNWANVEFEIS